MTPAVARALADAKTDADRGDALEALRLAAEEAAEAGVTVSISEWSCLTPEERSAFALARRAEVSRRLALLGQALGGPGVAQVIAEHDGGAALVRSALQVAHAETFGPPGRS